MVYLLIYFYICTYQNILTKLVDTEVDVMSPRQSELARTPLFECGIRSVTEDIHAYSEGRRRSPEEYASFVK